MPSDCTVMLYYYSYSMPNCMIGSEILCKCKILQKLQNSLSEHKIRKTVNVNMECQNGTEYIL